MSRTLILTVLLGLVSLTALVGSGNGADALQNDHALKLGGTGQNASTADMLIAGDSQQWFVCDGGQGYSVGQEVGWTTRNWNTIAALANPDSHLPRLDTNYPNPNACNTIHSGKPYGIFYGRTCATFSALCDSPGLEVRGAAAEYGRRNNNTWGQCGHPIDI